MKCQKVLSNAACPAQTFIPGLFFFFTSSSSGLSYLEQIASICFNLPLAHFIIHAVTRKEVLKLEVPQNWLDPLMNTDSQAHDQNV